MLPSLRGRLDIRSRARTTQKMERTRTNTSLSYELCYASWNAGLPMSAGVSMIVSPTEEAKERQRAEPDQGLVP